MTTGAHIPVVGSACPARCARRVGGGRLTTPPRQPAAAPSQRARRRGVSLLESTLFIAVSMAITLGGLAYYDRAAEADRVGVAVRQLSTLTAQVRTIYATMPDFSDLSAEVLIGSGALPAGGVNGTGDGLVSPWGAIELGPAPGNERRFMVTLYDLPMSACTRLGMYSSAGQGVVADNVTNFEVLDAGGALVPADAEVQAGRPTDGVSPSEAAAACSLRGGGVTLARWTFER